MQAIILAAGMGKRLKALTKDCTKCMVEVNGVSLIDRMLHQLEDFHLSRIVIVIGYQGDKLVRYIDSLDIQTPIVYINNEIYDKTNNIYSLALASDYLCKENTLLFESDLIFEDEIITQLLDDPRDTLALVDKYESWMDGTCIKLDNEDHITAFIPNKAFKFKEIKDYYKTVNIYKFGKEFSQKYYVPFLNAYARALGNNEYYEQVLRVITMLDVPVIQAKRLSGQRWYEIDDIQDLDIASSIFTEDKDKLPRLQKRGGGYWRYPKLLDFSNAGIPFFPPQRLLDEIKANIETITVKRPSNMSINLLLAEKNYDIPKENIAMVGNVKEAARRLVLNIDGEGGVIGDGSAFVSSSKSVYFMDESIVGTNNAEAVIGFASEKQIKWLFIENPNSRLGQYIARSEMAKIVQWGLENEVQIVYDESFSDFAEESNNSFLSADFLNHFPNLWVVKDFSAVQGVPGLQIGILACGDISEVERARNILMPDRLDSCSEFYLQIFEKYKKDYASAIVQFKAERSRVESELSKIKGVTGHSSQAAFVWVEFGDEISVDDVESQLLRQNHILVKKTDGNSKAIRFSIHTEDENDKMIHALSIILNGLKG